MPRRPVPLWTALASGFGALGLGVFLAFVYISLASHDRLADTCAVVEASRAEKRNQLKAFEESPPASASGRNLQESYAESLKTWDRLWVSLHCKEVTPRG